jgi:hypothetical protein
MHDHGHERTFGTVSEAANESKCSHCARATALQYKDWLGSAGSDFEPLMRQAMHDARQEEVLES